MKYIAWNALVYVALTILLIVFYRFYPGGFQDPEYNLAGYSILLLYGFIALAKSLFQVVADQKPYSNRIAIHLVGLIILISLLFKYHN
jgi:hypothetical protein